MTKLPIQHPFNPGHFQSDELRSFGFAHVGEGTAIARNCTIIGLENIRIGDFVRIDGFTSIIAHEGHVRIGSHVHICSGCVIGGRGGVVLGDYSSFSHGVRALSAIDDYDGSHMTNSTLPPEVLRVQVAPIVVGRHVPIGSGALLLPGAVIGEGAAIAAMSLVTGSLPEWTISGGQPAVPLKPRARGLLRYAADFEHARSP